jgi:anti-anti-sigma factor
MGDVRLTCQVDDAPFASIIRLSGEVDLSTIPTLRHALATAFSLGRHAIVDLANVTYIDSSGFRELLAHHRIYQKSDRLMVVVNPRQPNPNAFDKLNPYQIIPVALSLEIAKDLLKRTPRLGPSFLL